MTWKIDNSTTRGYKFTYDGLNRMLNAIYGEGDNLSSGIGRFSENVTEYDRNGNIKSLQRSGRTSASAYDLVDNLTLQYNGNQLINVSDASSDPLYSGAFNFVDGNKGTVTEYIYDSNGNLQQDFNKNIANIQHNMLNLPSVLQFRNGNRKDFQYSADGIRRRVTHQTAIANISVPMGQLKDLSSGQVSQTYTIDYCGNVIYENGSLSKVLTEEGYATLGGTTSLFDKGQTALDFFDKAILKGQNTDIVKRDFFNYSQPVLSKKIGNILSSIVGVTEVMGGKHDYRNVTVYNSWNIYSSVTNGKGRMLKYK